ncbi:hypothetical protein [Georgenia sp. SUBG003]|uniref:hypothetical protein n=1 Tax=Georgenia sp. SUBG003 TaxID=1497974 RepID=UPI003AB6F12E
MDRHEEPAERVDAVEGAQRADRVDDRRYRQQQTPPAHQERTDERQREDDDRLPEEPLQDLERLSGAGLVQHRVGQEVAVDAEPDRFEDRLGQQGRSRDQGEAARRDTAVAPPDEPRHLSQPADGERHNQPFGPQPGQQREQGAGEKGGGRRRGVRAGRRRP